MPKQLQVSLGFILTKNQLIHLKFKEINEYVIENLGYLLAMYFEEFEKFISETYLINSISVSIYEKLSHLIYQFIKCSDIEKLDKYINNGVDKNVNANIQEYSLLYKILYMEVENSLGKVFECLYIEGKKLTTYFLQVYYEDFHYLFPDKFVETHRNKVVKYQTRFYNKHILPFRKALLNNTSMSNDCISVISRYMSIDISTFKIEIYIDSH